MANNIYNKSISCLISIFLLAFCVSAQPSPDGEGTVVDLVRQAYERINDPIHVNRNTNETTFILKEPLNDSRVVYVSGVAHGQSQSYRIISYSELEICFKANGSPDNPILCRPLTDIVSISYRDHSYDSTQFKAQESRHQDDIGGLVYHMGENLEEDESLLLEFSTSFDVIEKIGILLLNERPLIFYYDLGTSYIQSYWDEYLCIWFIRHVSPGSASEQYYCVPYHNITSVQVIYDTNLAGDWDDKIVITDLLAERSPDLEIPTDFDIEATRTRLETWLEQETDERLGVSLAVPILLLDEPFTSLSIGHEADDEAPFYVTEIGSDYFCFSEDREIRSPTIKSACVTFYNVVEIQGDIE